MPPRDISSLLDYLQRNRILVNLSSNLLAQWGPQGRRFLGADFLPPRLLDDNVGEIERVHFYTVAAKDKTRYSPAPKVDGGQMFGTIRYSLSDAALLREFTSRDYDGLMRYLNMNQSMQALAMLEGFANTALLQALVERDEFKIWNAITTGGYGRFGDNGYVELVDGPNLAGQFVEATDAWSDPQYDLWLDAEARIGRLVGLGYVRSGIRVVTTDQVRSIMKANPHTALRAGKNRLVTDTGGNIVLTPISGVVDDADIDNIFRSLGVQAPQIYDLRGFAPGHGQKRFYPEGHMSFIASTGLSEEVRWNQDNPADVQIVNDVVGFLGIGRANGQQAPGRQMRMRSFLDQTDARLEGEGWETADPIMLSPEAVTGVGGIE